MKIIHSLDGLESWRGGAVTIGNFDGVHLGHARIMGRLVDRARALDGPALAFSFDPHPVRLLRPEQAPPPLTWTRRKADLLESLGVDALVAYPTDAALLQLSPEDFFQQVILERLAARAMVEGPNFRFGRDRTGDTSRLADLCRRAEIDLEIVPPLEHEGGLVSSSRVRSLIAEGDVDQARRLLTQPYRVRGMVTHGAARGAQLGFPTANLDAIDTLVPAPGVYAGTAYVDSRAYAAAMNIGPSPTFGVEASRVEVHLIDFQGNLYGEPLEVDFLRRLRDIHPFSSVDALVQQLRQDVQAARQLHAERPHRP